MGKKGDIGDWEDIAKKWLDLIYKLIEKPEKKEFEETVKLVTKTRKLLSESEYPINQMLVDDLRMQLAAVVNAAKYVIENVPKGNYYMVMPDFITHMSRVVLLISKVIQNVWSVKNGVVFEYVPPEASVYIPSQTGESFFRREMKGKPARMEMGPTIPTQGAPAQTTPALAMGYTYNPRYIYSKAYKYAYWMPRTDSGKRLYLAGLLTFLPSLLRFMREKSARGGLSPPDIQLLRNIFQRLKDVASSVNLEGLDLSQIREISDKILKSIEGFDLEKIQRTIGPVLEEASERVSPFVETSKQWLSENLPKLTNEIRDAISRGEITQVDLEDIKNAVKNVSLLAGDQIKELPKLANDVANDITQLAEEAAPMIQEAGITAAREARDMLKNFPTMIGSMGRIVGSVDLSTVTKSMQDITKQTDELIKSASDTINKLLKSIFG